MPIDIQFVKLDRLGASYIFKFNSMTNFDEINVYLNNSLINTFTLQLGEFTVNVDKSNLQLYGDDIRCEGKIGTIIYTFNYKIQDYVQTILSTGQQIDRSNNKDVSYYPETVQEQEVYMHVTIKNISSSVIKPEILADPSLIGIYDLVPFIAPYPAYDYERGYNDGFILGRYAK